MKDERSKRKILDHESGLIIFETLPFLARFIQQNRKTHIQEGGDNVHKVYFLHLIFEKKNLP